MGFKTGVMLLHPHRARVSTMGSAGCKIASWTVVLAVSFIVCAALTPTAEALNDAGRESHASALAGRLYRLRVLNKQQAEAKRADASMQAAAQTVCAPQRGCVKSGSGCVRNRPLRVCLQTTAYYFLSKQVNGLVSRCKLQPGCLVSNSTCIPGLTVQSCVVPAAGYYLGPNGDVKDCRPQPNCKQSAPKRCLQDAVSDPYLNNKDLPCLVPVANFIVKNERVYAVSVCRAGQYIVRDNTATQDRMCERCSCRKGWTADLSLCTGTTYYNAAKCTPPGSKCAQCTLGLYINATDTRCSCATCGPTQNKNADGTPIYKCPRFSYKSGSQCFGYNYMDTQSCTPCSYGGNRTQPVYACPAGFYRDGSICSGDTFADTQTCSACGNVQSATSRTYVCPSGSYITGRPCGGLTMKDTQTCGLCTPIDGCDPVAVTCTSPSDQVCSNCLGDYVRSSDGRRCALKCPAGSYAIGSPQTCADCPAGKFCTGVLEQPKDCGTRCPSGTWMTAPCDDTQDIQCKAWSNCLPGYEQSVAPTATYDRLCQECTVENCEHYSSGCTCNECEADFYAKDGICHECPEGYFCPGGPAQPAECSSNCRKCGTNGAGCQVCKPGFFINKNGACSRCNCLGGKVAVTTVGSNCDGTKNTWFPMDDGSCDSPIENETLRRALAVILKRSAAEGNDFCWKDWYDRGIGRVPTSCGDWDDVNGLCYQPCEGEYTPEPTCRTICKKEGCPGSDWTSYIYTCTLWQTAVRWQCGGDCPTGIGWSRSTVCTCQLNPVTIGKPTYDRSGRVRWKQCASELSWDAGLCYPTCKPSYNGIATRCYQDCSLNQLHKTDCGIMGCALTGQGCAAAIVDMVLAPILFLVNLVVTILTAGLGEAGFQSLTASLKATSSAIMSGAMGLKEALVAMAGMVRNAITDAFIKMTAAKLGQVIWDKFTEQAKSYLLHQFVNMLLVGAQAKSSEDMDKGLVSGLTSFDITGVTSMVMTFTSRPYCMDVNNDLKEAQAKLDEALAKDTKLNKKTF